jgi:hypothetical protein
VLVRALDAVEANPVSTFGYPDPLGPKKGSPPQLDGQLGIGEHVAMVELPYTPPSINQVAVGRAASRGAGIAATRAKKRLQSDLESMLLVERVPRRLEFVEATACLRFARRSSRRDEGNYRTPLEKALGDALVNGGWLADDTPDTFRFGRLTFDPERGEPRTQLLLRFRA